ncbi:hypothetical protein ONS95_007292 [Cadophora gregata]|uniref:uncharacterized protein n=1 Tax=Cadophora gregata TaxID=51156 RepID=UPI0026DDAAD7|nr:uncharacterized protein ONS95_007292 [Cadophora gregata]KAK0100845.1 hypothetical protein ONS95_007292 [Cadophora gregata]KAK0117163.1 hypothetical protein ONS96_012996 [Cadophora gregata f. sp. sojae]
MSTMAANGSSSSRSKKSSGAKHSTNSKSTSSKTAPKPAHVSILHATEDSAKSANSSRHYTPSERLLYYLGDTEHSNMGYSSAYTNALTYAYGFPDEREARRDVEGAMMTESTARALARIDEHDRRMEYD